MGRARSYRHELHPRLQPSRSGRRSRRQPQLSRRLKVLVATPLEPENVAVIKHAVPGIEVAYRPDLLPVPRYEGDHEGQPHMPSGRQNADWDELLRKAEVLLGLD